MDSLRIDAGVKRIMVNDDPERVIEFNPHDIVFAERFYRLLADFEAREGEFSARAEEIDRAEGDNMGERLAFLREVCGYMRAQIDGLFGDGTSQKAFGDSLVLEMFQQFFTGVSPFIQAARTERTAQYRPKKNSKRVMKGM